MVGTGPVVAGVVGNKKLIYDVWGDTVNLASRLTSECNPGDIQCDSATHDRLKGMFEFSDVTILPLKGKGDVATYRIVGRR